MMKTSAAAKQTDDTLNSLTQSQILSSPSGNTTPSFPQGAPENRTNSVNLSASAIFTKRPDNPTTPLEDLRASQIQVAATQSEGSATNDAAWEDFASATPHVSISQTNLESVAKMIALIAMLPDTKPFRDLRRAGRDLMTALGIRDLMTALGIPGTEITCKEPKKHPISREPLLETLYFASIDVSTDAEAYLNSIITFFKTGKAPDDCNFGLIQKQLKTCHDNYRTVRPWIEHEIRILRQKIKEGSGTPLKPEHQEHIIHQLHSILPPELITAAQKKSDTKYVNRQIRLERLEGQWDKSSLSLYRTRGVVGIIGLYLPLLEDLNCLKESTNVFSTKIQKLYEESEKASYTQTAEPRKMSIAESTIVSAIPAGAAKTLKDVIEDYKQYQREMEILQTSTANMSARIQKILSDAKEPVTTPYFEFMACPNATKGKALIIDLNANEERKNLAEKLVNAWNLLCVTQFSIKNEMRLAGQIQDVYAQLQYMDQTVKKYSSALRLIRKNTPPAEVESPIQPYIEGFNTLTAILKAKNTFVFSRSKEEVQGKGFIELYADVMKEIDALIEELNVPLTDVQFSSIGILYENDETNGLAKKNLEEARTKLSTNLKYIKGCFNQRYKDLQKSFPELVDELNAFDRMLYWNDATKRATYTAETGQTLYGLKSTRGVTASIAEAAAWMANKEEWKMTYHSPFPS